MSNPNDRFVFRASPRKLGPSFSLHPALDCHLRGNERRSSSSYRPELER